MKTKLITLFIFTFIFACQKSEESIDEAILLNNNQTKTTNKNSAQKVIVSNNTLLIMYKSNISFSIKNNFRNCLSTTLGATITNYETCSTNGNAEYITFAPNVHFEEKTPVTPPKYDNEDTMKKNNIINYTYIEISDAIDTCNNNILEFFSVISNCSDLTNDNNHPLDNDMPSL